MPTSSSFPTRSTTTRVHPPRRAPKKPRRKRGGRSHYQTGTWEGTKSPLPVDYRSGWERDVCRWLEQNPEVVRFFYESVVIPYVSNLYTTPKKVRRYFPDFLVEYKSGRKVLVEVKRADKVNTVTVQKKIHAGRLYAEKMGWEYEVWTDNVIKQIREHLDSSLSTTQASCPSTTGLELTKKSPKPPARTQKVTTTTRTSRRRAN